MMKQDKRAFWDTSSLLPLLCRDRFSSRSRELLRRYSTIIAWWGTPVEIHAAFFRLQRDGRMTASGVENALELFAGLRLRWREILPVDRVRQLAEESCRRHTIRSADALQLGAALVWCNEQPKGRNFICFDNRLLEAARATGFTVHSL
ncbi:type II toxin-antitoxin system VapC family toxin [bacterium]|nr:type II toxin-antitoxin system VapC family toxin [bacterium]MCI0605591.1 type II toxin-antitoxin system VapC family toxin [bacterium]